MKDKYIIKEIEFSEDLIGRYIKFQVRLGLDNCPSFYNFINQPSFAGSGLVMDEIFFLRKIKIKQQIVSDIVKGVFLSEIEIRIAVLVSLRYII